jgi:hypothetical protein
MLRRDILKYAVVLICICKAAVGTDYARAEFTVGIGNLSKFTEPASSRLHDGIADFNKMMGLLDVSNAGGAQVFRDSAVRAMQDAATNYEAAIPLAGDRILEPKPETDQERAEIQFFQDNAAKFGLNPPVTQKALIQATARIVRAHAASLQALDLQSLARNVRARQAITTDSTRMQNFLVSITTMLRHG